MLKLLLAFIFSVGCLVVCAQPTTDFHFEALIERNSLKLSGDTFLVKIHKGQSLQSRPGVEVIRQLDKVHFIIKTGLKLSDDVVSMQEEANGLWKASDNLLKQLESAGKRDLPVTIVLKSGKDVNDFLSRDSRMVWLRNGNILHLRIKGSELNALLDNPAIIFADLQRSPLEETIINDLDLSVNQVNRVHSDFPLLDGTGMTVSLKEQLYNVKDIDLIGRSIASPTQAVDLSGHATIMATLIGGNGNSFITGLGAAPAVRLTSSDYKNLSPDKPDQLRALGVSVQNHSYGTGIENYYGIEAAQYDQQILASDTVAHVFSAGNIGNAAPATGVYAGIGHFANLSGTFKQAKNVLVTGGTSNDYVAESLSSAGPAYDGRIKPELMAAGKEGTSGAAALTSGVISLLQQQYKSQTGFQPSSALIKSILINSADDLGPANPDFKHGFGMLNAYESIETIREGRFFGGSLSSGEEQVFPLQVTSPNTEIKVTLAWNDPSAPLNAPKALVNDLDLWLEDPAGNRVQPWVLNSFPHPDSLSKPAIRNRDSLNNVEQITLKGLAGSYKVHVSGYSVTLDKQAYFISYQLKQPGEFEWTSPVKDQQFFAGEENYLRWESTIAAENGVVSVSYDRGSTWLEISTADLKNGFLRWNSPFSFSQARLKMTVNGQEYLSEEFTLSTPMKLKVGYNCTDGVLLMWPRSVSAASYNLYTIKGNTLQILRTTADTSMLVSWQEISTTYFAVSPVHASGFEGLKSLTIDAASQGVGCYIQTLLADIGPGKTIALRLNLGTSFGLKSIRWEKQTGPGIYSQLGVSLIDSGQSYYFTDFKPKPGLQYYRVVLETEDGRQIFSDRASVIFLDGYQFTLFPNPVSESFTVLSGSNEDFELDIYNSQGQKIQSESFNNLTQSFRVANLKNGIYICVITLKGRVLFRSKIIKI